MKQNSRENRQNNFDQDNDFEQNNQNNNQNNQRNSRQDNCSKGKKSESRLDETVKKEAQCPDNDSDMEK
jgi:hypothetical protein